MNCNFTAKSSKQQRRVPDRRSIYHRRQQYTAWAQQAKSIAPTTSFSLQHLTQKQLEIYLEVHHRSSDASPSAGAVRVVFSPKIADLLKLLKAVDLVVGTWSLSTDLQGKSRKSVLLLSQKTNKQNKTNATTATVARRRRTRRARERSRLYQNKMGWAWGSGLQAARNSSERHFSERAEVKVKVKDKGSLYLINEERHDPPDTQLAVALQRVLRTATYEVVL